MAVSPSPPSPPAPSPRRWFIYLAVILILGFSTWYFAFRAKPEKRYYPQPAWAGTEYPTLVPVRTVTAELVDLPVHLKAIGTVTPFNTVTVKSRVSGQLLRVTFEEGQRVQRGDLLAEIDPAPYRIALAEAEGQLKQSSVQVETAKRDLERLEDLHQKKLITDQELDAQRAMVGQRSGALASVQAQVDNARLQLAYTRIEAPITGRVGFRQVDPGNLVSENSATGLVVITQTRPIAVTFTIPEVALPSVVEPFRAGKVLTVEAWDRQESAVLATGTLKTVDNQIDTATGTLRLKAEFANTDDQLFPNQFVNVRMRVGTLEKSVVIPAAAVQFGSRGTYVYVIDAKKKATVRNIVLGPTDGTRQAVTTGLAPGDVVVLEGLDRLREGRGVVVTNEPASAP
ncbi:MAG: MdtA/MuxA family multidrug efflux RND transporter periplasmic adaptor subunit [Lacunisphaera sp.]